MVQQLRAQAAFQRTRGQFPAPTWRPTTIYNSSSRGFNTLFWASAGIKHARGAVIQHMVHMLTNT